MGTNNLYPRKSAALADNAVDIGQSSYRFKDLYLSGTAYVSGINTSNTALDINSGTSNIVATFTSTDTEAQINLVDTTGSAQIRSRNDLRFYVNGGSTRAVDIDSSGNLLVGKTSNDAGYAHQFQSGTSDVTFNAYRPNTSSSSSIAIFSSDAGGSFSSVCAIRCDGDLENTNNSYGALSDERLKSNIVDASSQIDDIMAVQVRSYTLNKTGDTHIGVVAQELEASGMSGLVQENEEGMKSVKYSVLYMKAIKALQEAVTRIETLEAEVAALKGA